MTAYVWQRWMLSELRAAAEPLGIRVSAVAGWEDRGRPASTGGFDPQGPTTTHHTGTTTSASNPKPTLRMLVVGRPDLPGPLSQVSVAYDGEIIVIAAGRANHAGRVERSGAVGMPLGADGNALALGDEVDTNGTQALPEAQRRSIAVVNAVFLRHFGKEPEWCHRHEDITPRKWDLGSLTTPQLRSDAAALLEELDMPTAKEIAREVWNTDLSVGGEKVRAGRVLVGAYNRAHVAPKLADLAKSVERLVDEAEDDATKQQARRILAEVRAAQDAATPPVDDDADGTTEEG